MPWFKRSSWLIAFVGLASSAARGVDHPQPSWLPEGLPSLPASGPALCPRDFLTPAQGAALLDATLRQYPDRAAWDAYASELRVRIRQGAGLDPWPERTALNPTITSRREHDGYTVENVRLETRPGVYSCGNLYRPRTGTGRRPAVLTTHGHTAPIKEDADWERHGRFTASAQTRAATLARMGAVVLTLDMFGYGDSFTQFGADAHRSPHAMTVQVWNAIRALDFLESLPDVDSSRIGVTGESGGGTQAFLLAALDQRIAVSVPVVMVSSYFFGGCPCESGRPIHRSADHFASNAVIAALTAPRPQLVVSDGKDWTQHTPDLEFPFLQRVYRYFGAEQAVSNVHLPTEGHDYGPSKRAALYTFLAQQFGLSDAAAACDETRVTVEGSGVMRVFASDVALPRGALRRVEEVARVVGPPP